MPPVKKPTQSRSRASAFKEPAALKRLNKSLANAHEALAELRKDTSQGARVVYTDVRGFVTNARRDTGKLAKALARDFEEAQKKANAAGSSARAKATSRAGRASSTAKRTTRASKKA